MKDVNDRELRFQSDRYLRRADLPVVRLLIRDVGVEPRRRAEGLQVPATEEDTATAGCVQAPAKCRNL